MKDFISKSEMNNYGYLWDGMIPLPKELAEIAWLKGCLPVYKLYEDDSESMIEEYEDFKYHSEDLGIFGIEKNDLESLISFVEKLKSYKVKYEGGFNCVD